MKVLYTATATAVGGRRGRVKASDGRLDLELSVPKEMGGDGGDGTNPEQLFAAGYAACFESSLRAAAKRRKRSVTNVSVTAIVGIGRLNEDRYGLEIELRITIAGLPRSESESLVAEAHRVCPYSNATRGNVDVNLVVE